MKKYKIIYADPPWRYARSKVQGAAEKHYPTMSIEELCALPVKEIADKDCILFLWATFPQLKEALQLIKAWGFTYKSVAFVWLKQNRKSPTWFYGLGFWTRGNAEICLLATKGHPKRQSNKVHQFIISPVEQHSKKPDITREKILALMGDLPRIELFARQHTIRADLGRKGFTTSQPLFLTRSRGIWCSLRVHTTPPAFPMWGFMWARTGTEAPSCCIVATLSSIQSWTPAIGNPTFTPTGG